MNGCAMYSVVVPASDGIYSESLCICYKVYLLPYVYGESGFGVGLGVRMHCGMWRHSLLHCVNLILRATI